MHHVISIAVFVFAGVLLVLLGQDVFDIVRPGRVYRRRRQAPIYFRALLRLSKGAGGGIGAWLLAIGAGVLIAGLAVGYLSRGGANHPRAVTELNGAHRDILPFDGPVRLNAANSGHTVDGGERSERRP